MIIIITSVKNIFIDGHSLSLFHNRLKDKIIKSVGKINKKKFEWFWF